MDRYKVVKASRSQVDPATGHLLLDVPGAGGGSEYELPVASGNQLGGVRVGRGLTMEGSTLHADPLPIYDDTDLQNRTADNAAAIEDLRDVVPGKQDQLVAGETLKTINGQSLLGAGDLRVEGSVGGTNPTFELPTATDVVKGGIRAGVAMTNTYMVGDVLYVDNMRYDDVPMYNMVVQKQDRLVDGWNVKTVNGESILGVGNIELPAGGGGGGGGSEARTTYTYGEGFTFGPRGDGGEYSGGMALRDSEFIDVGTWNLNQTRVVETLDRVTLYMEATLQRDVPSDQLGQFLEVNYNPGTLIPNRTTPVFLEMLSSPWGTLSLNPETPSRLKGSGLNQPLYVGQIVILAVSFDKLHPEWMEV